MKIIINWKSWQTELGDDSSMIALRLRQLIDKSRWNHIDAPGT
jgi:hypothetical protein